MIRRACATVALVIACAVLVSGQSPLAGTWKGETAQGQSVSLALEVKGEALTGTITIGDQSVPIYTHVHRRAAQKRNPPDSRRRSCSGDSETAGVVSSVNRRQVGCV